MDVSFLNFSATIPDAWEDRSTMTFQVPPTDGTKASPGNVVISWRDGDDALGHLDHQLSQLSDLVEKFELVEKGLLDDEARGAIAEIKFVAHRVEVRQLLIVRHIGGRLVLISGTATEDAFETLWPQFVDVAQSLDAR